MSKNFFTYDQHKAFNEIVFEHRNKEYGAYAIRNESNVLLKKAFFIGVSLFMILAILPLLIAKLNKTEDKPILGKTHQVIFIPDDKPIEKPVKKIVETVKLQIKTAVTEVPIPTNKTVKEETVSSKKEIENSAIGFEKKEGEMPTSSITPTTTVNTEKPIEKPKQDANAIPINVDVEADFLGGINSFRNKVLENFDTSSVESESGEIIKAVVTFVVERDGSISNIKVSGVNSDFNKQAEKTVKSVKGKWNPAKLQGENVRSYFRFPISMQFE